MSRAEEMARRLDADGATPPSLEVQYPATPTLSVLTSTCLNDLWVLAQVTIAGASYDRVRLHGAGGGRSARALIDDRTTLLAS